MPAGRGGRVGAAALAAGAGAPALLLAALLSATAARASPAGVSIDEPFAVTVFPVGLEAVDPWNARLIAVLDHSGGFYTRCCNTRITAYTGESVDRGALASGCPQPPTLPACFSDACNDYTYGFGTPLLAPRGGQLCKAREDPINGRFGFASAWDKFHTFYVDHGSFQDGRAYASWLLHATDLAGNDTTGAPLTDLGTGQCAPVATGQLVATVGNAGTFAPHLHFEVRVYEPLFGPEHTSANVIDPYGWSGESPDPWSQIGGNPQAESRTDPVWLPEPRSDLPGAAALVALAAFARLRPPLRAVKG